MSSRENKTKQRSFPSGFSKDNPPYARAQLEGAWEEGKPEGLLTPAPKGGMQGAEKGQGQALVPLRFGSRPAAPANKAPLSASRIQTPNSSNIPQSVMADGLLQGIAASLNTGSHGRLEAAVDDKGSIWGVFESSHPSKESASSLRLPMSLSVASYHSRVTIHAAIFL